MSKKARKKTKPKIYKKRRTPRVLSATLNSIYVEPENAEYVRTEGDRLYGSFSNYINVLIARDRGVAPHPGKWKPTAKGAGK